MRLIDRKRLKDGGAYSQNCKKHSRSNMLSEKISRELSFKIAEYPLHQLLRLGRQEIHIALSNPNTDVRILAQGFCVAIVSLSLLWNWHWTIRRNTQSFVNEARSWMYVYVKVYNWLSIKWNKLINCMQGWHYGKWLIYYRPIFRLTRLAFLRARAR